VACYLFSRFIVSSVPFLGFFIFFVNKNVHPYTRVMAQCLGDTCDPKNSDNELLQCSQNFLLTNMLQGCLMVHMKERISGYYHISVDSLGEKFDELIFDVFNEDLFALFRKKIEETPSLVLELCKKIVDAEMDTSPNREKRLNLLYLSIFCRHLGYKNIRTIFTILESDPRIQEEILSAPPKTLPS